LPLYIEKINKIFLLYVNHIKNYFEKFLTIIFLIKYTKRCSHLILWSSFKWRLDIMQEEYFGIKLDLDKDKELTEFALKLLEQYYLVDGETSPQQSFARAALAYSGGDLEFAQRIYDYASKSWFVYASPVLSNAPTPGKSWKSLPISCFLSFVPDSLEGLIDHTSELRWLSVKGGGVGGHWSSVRSVSNKAPGPIPFLKTVDADMTAYRQGTCYTPDTEVLTSAGWVRFDQLSEGVEVGHVNSNREIFFAKPIELVKEDHVGHILNVRTGNNSVDLQVTPNHSMVIEERIQDNSWSGELVKIRADHLVGNKDLRFHTTAIKTTGENTGLTPLEKYLIASNIIGQKNEDYGYTFIFEEASKANFLENIIKECGYHTTKTEYSDGTIKIVTKIRVSEEEFCWVDLSKISSTWGARFLGQIFIWLGGNKNGFVYKTKSKKSVDIIQAVASISNLYSKIETDFEHYTISVGENKPISLENLEIEEIPYSGKVYCATVSTGMLLVRRSGVVTVCGNTRKGSYAAYLDISHPDILEFLHMRVPTGGDPNRKCFNLHNAVNITDDFMQACINDSMWELKDPADGTVRETIRARELMETIIEVRYQTGEPYLNFIDTANRHLPQPLKDLNLKINGSNLCLTGDQRVVTNRGILTARELYEQGGDLIVWDDNSTQSATPMMLIEKNAPVFKITLKNGMTHTVTGYHKVKTERGDISCNELTLGDRVCIQTNKGIFGSNSMEDEAFLLGLYQADGTQNEKTERTMIDIWEPDFDLIPEVKERFDRIHLKYGCHTYDIKNQKGEVVGSRHRNPANFRFQNTGQSTVKKVRLSTKTFIKAKLGFEKGIVPNWIWSSDEATQWQYIRGLFYADGTVSVNEGAGNPVYLSLSNINKSFLSDIILILRNLGMSASLYSGRKAGTCTLPNGKGGQATYNVKECWRAVIGNKNDALAFEANTKFLSRKGISIPNREYRNNTRKVSEVISIEPMGIEDVFCLTVDSESHHFVCNGIITKNCNEIHLPTSPERTAVCCLSSLNLRYYDEWKDTTIVKDLIRFLDNVLQVFIDQAPPVLHKAIYSATRERSLGLGAMGFHDLIQSKNIPWESVMAKILNMEVFSHIKSQAVEATEELAKEKGEYLDGIGSGRRNSHLLAIAPNANSSIIANTSASIEPWKSNAYTHRTRTGSFLVKNPELDKVLSKYIQEDQKDAIWQSIILAQGSVQHLDFLTEWEKSVFKTAFELDQRWVVDHAASRQEFICQGQSVNLFFPAGSDKNYVLMTHLKAWKDGLKGLYYLRTSAGVDPEKVSAKVERVALADYVAGKEEECLSCQG
jgi:ribonucleoside-diphosphate reductase alpha chain